MAVFLFTLILVFVIALGGRDQMVMGELADRLGRSSLLLATGIACAVASAAAMAWLGGTFADILPLRAARMLVAFALAVAALELALPARRQAAAAEPTRSLGAIALVLLARQIGDAARFVVFAYAVLAHYPIVSALGGAIGGAAAIALGWMAGGATLARYPLRWWRRGLALCLFVAAIFIGLNARYVAL